jgi:hypothetical protein
MQGGHKMNGEESQGTPAVIFFSTSKKQSFYFSKNWSLVASLEARVALGTMT